MGGSPLSHIGDVARALEPDGPLAHWSIERRGDGYLFVRPREGDVTLLVAWPELWKRPERLAEIRANATAVIALGGDDDFAAATAALDAALVPVPATPMRLAAALDDRATLARLCAERADATEALERARYERDLLISIGRALSQERDIDSLLGRILYRARDVSGADAGSVYVVEGDSEEVSERTLRFAVWQNDSVRVESSGFTVPVSPSSIVGACVIGREVINIPDLYDLDPPGTGNNPWSFVHDRSFDDRAGYQTRSMLTVPMISAREEVIGVIQLINKKAGWEEGGTGAPLTEPDDFARRVVAFDGLSMSYAVTLASQAGIALENALLYDEVKTLFEGFVHASVTAIESRDPTTSGHSERVAELTCGLARAADRADTGPYRQLVIDPTELKQIEYAALLHDFGKVGVREGVLVKAKKLYPHERALILARFDFIRRTIEAEQSRAKVSYLVEASREEVAAVLAEIDDDAAANLAELDEFLRFILAANEPTVLEKGGFERLAEIAARTYVSADGGAAPYLTGQEVTALQIPRGSLTADERDEIQSHVVHTYNFLRRIPWGRTFRGIPDIAGAHHEKLDGSGYPRGLTSDAIPVPAKMMTISDIYDALTASDRPYKRAVPEARALDILGFEVKDGHLDPDLFQIFLDAKIYELVRPKN